MPEWLPVLATIFSAVLINGAGYYLAHSQRDKNRSDAASSLTGSALSLVQRWEKRVLELEQKVQELEERYDELEERYDELERENRCLRVGAERLEGQVVSLGHRPVFSLKELAGQDG